MSHPPTSSLFMPPCTGKTFTTSASPSVLCAMICAEPPRSYTTGRSGTRHHSAVTAPLNGGSGVKLDQCRIISIMQQPNAPSIGTGSRGDRGAARYFFMFSQRFAPTLTLQRAGASEMQSKREQLHAQLVRVAYCRHCFSSSLHRGA